MLLNQSQQHNIVTVIFMLFIASESGSYKERKKEKISNTLIANILNRLMICMYVHTILCLYVLLYVCTIRSSSSDNYIHICIGFYNNKKSSGN